MCWLFWRYAEKCDRAKYKIFPQEHESWNWEDTCAKRSSDDTIYRNLWNSADKGEQEDSVWGAAFQQFEQSKR